MLLNVIGYISTIRNKPYHWEIKFATEKKNSPKSWKTKFTPWNVSVLWNFITMPAADPVDLEQRREGGGGGGSWFVCPTSFSSSVISSFLTPNKGVAGTEWNDVNREICFGSALCIQCVTLNLIRFITSRAARGTKHVIMYWKKCVHGEWLSHMD